MTKRRRLRVALRGGGDQTERWAAALSGLAEVRPPPEHLPGAIDALVLTTGAGDPFARAKEALLADTPVLYAAPFLLSPWQAGILDELSRRQGCLLRFVEPFRYRPGFTFLHRLLAGEEPFWRPLYLRTLRLAQPDGPARIDQLATEELAICETLLNDSPRWVSAVASRRDEVAEVCAVFLTLHDSDGPLAQCTISLAEANSAHQLVAVTASRTVILDDLDPVAPLRIEGGGAPELCAEGPPPVPPRQGGAEGPPAGPDPVAEEANRFLGAVAAGDRAPANGARWTRVAALWWAARQSLSSGGPMEVPSPALRPGDAEPPPLRVIRGGGRPAPAAWQRPPLTVVAR